MSPVRVIPATKTADIETRILREFTSKATDSGPGSVVMAELARDLGISTKTLYAVFGSKADLVHRLTQRWAARLDRQLEGDDGEGPFVDQLLRTSEVWQAHRRRFGDAFWEQLEQDYPESYALVVDARQRVRERMRQRITPYLRPELSPQVAIELFDAALARAMDPEVQQRLGVSGRAAIGAAVSVWARGALVETLRTRQRPVKKSS